jgi:hypothetical protein
MQPAPRKLLNPQTLLRLGFLAAVVVLIGVLVWQVGGTLWGRKPAGTDQPAQNASGQQTEEAATAKEPEDNPLVFRDERDIVPPLRADLLDKVRDSRGLPVLPADLKQATDRDIDEIDAYMDAVEKAYRMPAHTFANSANRELTYGHLENEPRKHRGQVAHFEGTLKRVRRYDPPMLLAQAGVRDIYEGWIFDVKQYGVNPVCAIFTELPQGIPVAEDVRQDVAFDGYFFKKYRYVAGDSKPGQAREVPLLIGHAPVRLHPVAVADSTPPPSAWMGWLLTGLLAFIAAVLGLALVLHAWFQRADRKVQRRLEGARQREFVPPAPDAGVAVGQVAPHGEPLAAWLEMVTGVGPEPEGPAQPARGVFPADPLGRGEPGNN